MFQLLAFVFSFVSALFAIFWSPIPGWISLAIPEIIIAFVYWGVRSAYRFNRFEELSEEANSFLQQYGHYFAKPFASRDFSAAAATLQIAGVALALINLFMGFWWGIAIAAVNWILMNTLACRLSPTALLTFDKSARLAHDEVKMFIESRGND